MANDVWTRYARCAEFLVWRVIALPAILISLGFVGFGLACYWQFMGDPGTLPETFGPWRPLLRLVMLEAALVATRGGWREACAALDGRGMP